MSFEKKELTAEQVDRMLDGVLIGTPKAKDAPLFSHFERAADFRTGELQRLMQDESFKRYKAMDKSGQVWRIQNPALLSYQMYLGISPVRDIIRERVSDEELGRNLPALRGKGRRATVEVDL